MSTRRVSRRELVLNVFAGLIVNFVIRPPVVVLLFNLIILWGDQFREAASLYSQLIERWGKILNEYEKDA